MKTAANQLVTLGILVLVLSAICGVEISAQVGACVNFAKAHVDADPWRVRPALEGDLVGLNAATATARLVAGSEDGGLTAAPIAGGPAVAAGRPWPSS